MDDEMQARRRRNWRQIRMIVLVILTLLAACGLILSLAKDADVRQKQTKTEENASGKTIAGYERAIDAETGCEYFVNRWETLTLRYDSNGKPMCGKR